MNKPYYLRRFALIGVLGILWTHSLPALSLILPMEAIYDSGRLRQDEFKKKYPGIDVSSDIPDEVGYYVRYTHDNLTYYFGPVDVYITAEQKSFELQEIVDLATFELPYLKGSEVFVWQFSDGMFEDTLSGGSQQEGLQVAEIGQNTGSSGSSQSNEQGTIINAGQMSVAQMAQMQAAQENGEQQGQMSGSPGQQGQMSGQQQAQQIEGQMSQNQSNQSSQSQQSQSTSGSSGSGQSQGQQQQQGGGMSIWKMLGRIFGM